MIHHFDLTHYDKEYNDLNLDDKSLITLILEGDSSIAASFLLNKCFRIFEYINRTRLVGLGLNTNDLVSDFYIFLQQNDWEKLRQFRFESKLQTWINLVASRYFLKKYAIELKERGREHTPIDSIAAFVDENTEQCLVRSEILEAISLLKDKRSQKIIILGLQGFDSSEIADILNTTTNNVYVIRSRAIINLKNQLNG